MGNLRAQFDQNGRIDILDLVTTEHNEYVPRAQLPAAVESPDLKQSPSASKAAGKRASQQRGKQQLQVPQEQTPQKVVPTTMVNIWGVTNAVLSFLEVTLDHRPKRLKTILIISLSLPNQYPKCRIFSSTLNKIHNCHPRTLFYNLLPPFKRVHNSKQILTCNNTPSTQPFNPHLVNAHLA